MLLDASGRDMQLTTAAETGARAYVTLGGVLLVGHRELPQQAHEMAANIIQRIWLHRDRNWIALTYLHGDLLQAAVDAHPEAKTAADLAALLLDTMQGMTNEQVSKISHHLALPCPCFDGQPALVPQNLVSMLPGITKVIFHEGGLLRCHMEFEARLPDVKMA